MDRTGKVKINRTEYLFLLLLVLLVLGTVIYFSMFYEPPVTSEISSGGGSGIVAEDSGEIKNANANTLVNNTIDLNANLIDVPEEYFSSINAGITLEQLESSKVVLARDTDISYKGTPYGFADVRLYGRVVEIDIDGRTLVIEREGDFFEIYIGKNAWLLTPDRTGMNAVHIVFGQIEVDDEVDITTRLQFGRGDPLIVIFLVLHPH